MCPEEVEDGLINFIKPEEACGKAAKILHMARLQRQIKELTFEEDIEEEEANEVLVDSDIEDSTASARENEETISCDEDNKTFVLNSFFSFC
ncbi:hypothetical protein Trydic_g6022 [Trypoxylus dichotomus]